MKLIKIDYYLDWPKSLEIENLRKYIIDNISKKGIIIRWSIVDIHDSVEANKCKKIRINAVLANQINS